jgi:hypothetical protein
MLSKHEKFIRVSCLMILFAISTAAFGGTAGYNVIAKKFSLRPGQRARVTITSDKPISANMSRGYYKTGSWNFAGSTVWKSGRKTSHRCDIVAPSKPPSPHYTMGKHKAVNWQYQVYVTTVQPKGGYATRYKVNVNKK